MEAHVPETSSPGLHNSESSKGQIITINFLRDTEVSFISM